MTRHLRSALAMLTLPALLLAEEAPTPAALTVGSPAPVLKASRWLKGTPVVSFEKGKVYVVEFWATWCGPCRQSIPHLTKLAKTFEGKATFVGMSVWERGESPQKLEANVDAFVKDMGDKMAYTVARDTSDAHMANAWMKAAAQNGIPAAFIVNTEGQIAWIGHPMYGLDKALASVVAGTYDMAAAKVEAQKAAAEEALRSKAMTEFGKPIMTALTAKDYAKVLNLTQEATAKYPSQAELFERPRFTALLHTDEAKASAMLDAEKAKAEPDMTTFAVVIVTESGLAKSWYLRAVDILEAELKSPEASPALWAYLAKGLHLSGRSQEAAVIQERYVKEARGKASEARLKQYEADLKTYQDAAKTALPADSAVKTPAKASTATKG